MTSTHSLLFSYKFCWFLALILFSVNTEGQENVLNYFRLVNLPDEHIIHADAEDTIRNLLDTLLNRLKCVQRGLTFLECFRCLTPASVLKTLLVKASSHSLNMLHIRRLSVIFLYHIFNFETICREKQDTSLSIEYIHYRNSTKRLLEEDIENQVSFPQSQKVMRQVKMIYQPLQSQKCVTIEDVWTTLNQTDRVVENEVELFSSVFMSYILSGRCLSVVGSRGDFVDQIFLEYSNKCTGKLNVEGLDRLITHVTNSPVSEHDRKETEECPKESNEYIAHTRYPVRIDLYSYEYEVNTSESLEDKTESFSPSLDRNVPDSHKDGNLRERNNSEPLPTRARRSVKYPIPDKGDVNLARKCWKTDELVTLFQPTDNDGGISQEEFSQLCPALLQQIIAGCCKPTSAAALEKESNEEIATAELYCYSSLAVLIISLSSLGGLLLMPIVSSGTYHYIMACFIGLAFSTMTCDALLHLIPQGLGLHQYNEKSEEEHDSKDHTAAHIRSVCQQVTVLVAIYLLFLFEAITEITVKSKHHKKEIVRFLYYPPQTEDEKQLPMSVRIRGLSAMSAIKEKSESHMELAKRPRSVAFITPVEGDNAPNNAPILKSEKICGGLTSVAWVVTLADNFHNFGDGLAIGAAFHCSLESGLFTSIAVLCHELPHEFGDFALLLSTGLSFAKALAINFISALSCFIGLYVGLQIGDNRETRKWIMSATAGIFLYVSLVEILPELKKTRGMNPYKMLAVKNMGMILGVAFMISIAAYEDKINI